MATRTHRAAAAPQPANRGAPVLAGKQKAAAAAGRRQALGDIGNVVTDVLVGKIKLPEGINRPITRSFGAQLLKNAQANAALAKQKAVAPVPVPARPVPKPARKAPAKPAPRAEQAPKIVTGSDENRKPSEGAAGSSSSVCKNSRKKVVCTLTTVLSARSKLACGLTEKPKALIEDIDKLDGDNQLAIVEYVEDIYKFYKAAQHECRPTDYTGSQPELTPKMRGILTDWIIEVHGKFELMPETLYLTMYIVDRYLSLQPVPRREVQLVGIAALLIACKYEEIWAPGVNEFIEISDDAYSRHQILVTEKSILNTMEWNLTVPTQYHFLVRFAKAAGSSGDKELEHMIFFFGEMALMEYGMVTMCPSMVAASAVYAARCTLKKRPLWTDTLRHHTGLDEPQLMEAVKMLVSSHAAAPEGKLKTVFRKYATDQFAFVSMRPPASVV